MTEVPSSTSSNSCAWPARPTDAFSGIVGDIVSAIDPHSEADPIAIAIQVLVAFGNVIGRDPHVRVEADRHTGALFAVLVGETSRARKGTSGGYLRPLFAFDENFDSRLEQGLSSGEGLVHRIRDRRVIVKTGGEEEVLDEGIADKRVVVLESEFASVLRMTERSGNTLSPVIRSAWDGSTLGTLTKSNAQKATGPHVSIIGHVTLEELRHLLGAIEVANGFGNRFIWAAVRRSKLLPDGGNLRDGDLAALSRRLGSAVHHASRVGEMRRDEDARRLWFEMYPELTTSVPGVVGALTARAEAQVVRLSLLYALLDESDVIDERHLIAALDLWNYCRDSVIYAFGDKTGNTDADAILRNLRTSDEGLTRTEISAVFGRNLSAARLDSALTLLHENGLATVETVATGGRPAERWSARTKETNFTKEVVAQPTPLSLVSETREDDSIAGRARAREERDLLAELEPDGVTP
ncbi:MAG: hypothetical protein U0R50_09155 [Gaiellales bacterium]